MSAVHRAGCAHSVPTRPGRRTLFCALSTLIAPPHRSSGMPCKFPNLRTTGQVFRTVKCPDCKQDCRELCILRWLHTAHTANTVLLCHVTRSRDVCAVQADVLYRHGHFLVYTSESTVHTVSVCSAVWLRGCLLFVFPPKLASQPLFEPINPN